MIPEVKRFVKRYQPIYDTIARLNVDQEVREQVARALYGSLSGQPDFKSELFLNLASDPLVDCAGPRPGQGCPHGREIRVSMHDHNAPDGRAANWQSTLPEVRCISCGAERFMGVV